MKKESVISFLDENLRKNYTEEDDGWLELLENNDADYKKYSTNFFKNHADGLFLDNGEEVRKIYLCVFPSKSIIERVLREKNVLLLSHHLLDYNEIDKRFHGFGENLYQSMKKQGNSFYFLHISLDKDLNFSPSVSLAEYIGLEDISYVSKNDFGGELVLGEINKERLFDKIDEIFGGQKLLFGDISKKEHLKVSIGAGSGEIPFFMDIFRNLGIDMYITGSIFAYGSEYIENTIPPFIYESLKNQISVSGLTHYRSEYFWMYKLKRYIQDKLEIEVEILSDVEKEKELKENFLYGSDIQLTI